MTKKNRAFTIIELLVVVSVFAMMGGMVLFNYSQYAEIQATRAFTKSIALSLREAQVAANGVKENPHYPGPPSDFMANYGVYTQVGRESFIEVVDSMTITSGSNQDNLFDGPIGIRDCGNIECLQENFSSKGVSIDSLCVDATGPVGCAGNLVNELHVIFENSSLNLLFNDNPALNYAEIRIRSPRGKTGKIFMWGTGIFYTE